MTVGIFIYDCGHFFGAFIYDCGHLYLTVGIFIYDYGRLYMTLGICIYDCGHFVLMWAFSITMGIWVDCVPPYSTILAILSHPNGSQA
jgi:hypothetical protein